MYIFYVYIVMNMEPLKIERDIIIYNELPTCILYQRKLNFAFCKNQSDFFLQNSKDAENPEKSLLHWGNILENWSFQIFHSLPYVCSKSFSRKSFITILLLYITQHMWRFHFTNPTHCMKSFNDTSKSDSHWGAQTHGTVSLLLCAKASFRDRSVNIRIFVESFEK